MSVLMSAIGQKRTLDQRLKTPKEGHSRISASPTKRTLGGVNIYPMMVSPIITVITPGLLVTGFSASEIAATRRRLISDYADFIARANERIGTNVTL